jgi:formamidopyrimidine-DNA glycosylase
MPELPEVETVRSGLASSILGFTITDVEILDARSLKKNAGGPKSFVREATGAKLNQVVRRGKFFWFPISRERALVGHLGMSGQILVRKPGEAEDKCTRVIFSVSKGRSSKEIRFIDQRLFGGLYFDDLVPTSDDHPAGFSPESEVEALIPGSAAHIARDLLDPFFDAKTVIDKLLNRKTGIKNVLLDQNLLSGIGNIYADEALWLAKLHYNTPAESLSKKKAFELIEITQDVLRKAVAEGGTSFDEQYKNVNGESGYFAVSLNAYGQTDEPCPRCGTPIRRDAWSNRGSHFCPRCQKLKA